MKGALQRRMTALAEAGAARRRGAVVEAMGEAGVASVRGKSFPLNSNGSSVAFAKA